LQLAADGAGLPVFHGESWEEHVSAWIQVEEKITDLKWFRGAIVESLDRRYGRQGVKKFAAEVGCKARKLYMYAQTYREYRDEYHRAIEAKGEDAESATISTLSWSHHYNAAVKVKDPERRREILKQAEEENWSVESMNEFIKTGKVERPEPNFVLIHRPPRKGETKRAYSDELTAAFNKARAEYLGAAWKGKS
jgi:hypothetical protein